MAKQDSNKGTKSLKNSMPNFIVKRLIEGMSILILTGALFMLLSLSTYHISDPGWSHASRSGNHILNSGGTVGSYIADALYFVFGYLAYFLPVGVLYAACLTLKDCYSFKSINQQVLLLRAVGFLMVIAAGCGLLNLDPTIQKLDAIHTSGGIIGQVVSSGWYQMLNLEGALLILSAMLLVGITWFTGFSWLKAIDWLGFYTEVVILLVYKKIYSLCMLASSTIKTYLRRPTQPIIKAESHRDVREKSLPKLLIPRKEKTHPLVLPPIIETVTINKPIKEPRLFKQGISGELPHLNLLDKGQPGKPMGGYSHQELENVSRDVEQHLLDFGIQADVVAVHPGPVVTRFELQLAAGVKVSKLTALAKDLARSLSVISVRVVEVIPGKTVVGIELPNQSREMVRLADVLSAEVYQNAHSMLTLALGVDIAGHPMVVDLAKMPHLLVAGTTGSGKSVGINAMILSILFKATPEQVRLIMIDPKMLELSVYDGIPHLLTPVVTDMKEAASALRWCVEEMERRYKLMASLGVRNLSGYNTKVLEAISEGQPLSCPFWKPTDSMDAQAPLLQTLPCVVVVIDELADMMMVVGKKVEQLIARIAQKARAAGIHMILATQRPSVDVLTGLIKSNIPTRISFQVSSKIDSRTILDQQGAEQLLGHGDMLFLAPGSGAPLRVHGAFVDDKEVHRIADDWRARGEPDYIDDILKLTQDGEGGSEDEGQAVEDEDPLYDQAVEFVLQTRKASISSVQRRLKIGYNRAARIIEEMERTGIVGPLDGGYRDVLVTSIRED
ncbi:MAG: DNA translocase FtsK 4TM domain-containing protein [Legionella sp.]|nr:DNA translocase FtsK 4TM domain-containing protein [Legionella sp.]